MAFLQLLEEPCRRCESKGWTLERGVAVNCTECDGTGHKLTDFGESAFAVVGRLTLRMRNRVPSNLDHILSFIQSLAPASVEEG